MSDNKCYDIYLNKISKEKIETISDEKVNKYYDELLNILPNGGKLYKYRSFRSNRIDDYLKALENKYLWIPSASEMKDIKDSSLNIILEKDFDELRKFAYDNPYLIAALMMKKSNLFSNVEEKIIRNMVDEVIKCIDPRTGEIKTSAAVASLAKYNINKVQAKAKIEEVKAYIKNSIESNADVWKKSLNDIIAISDDMRNDIHIFSMCERYDNNFLWDEYSDADGFCIEYDFNKAKSAPIEIKRKLLMTFKVRYFTKLERFSIAEFYKRLITEDIGQDFIDNQGRVVLNQLLSKKKDYVSENEWRIIQFKTDNKMYVDLISAIIVDEKGLNYEKAKRLLEIAKKHEWNIIERKYYRYNSEFIYKKIDVKKK